MKKVVVFGTIAHKMILFLVLAPFLFLCSCQNEESMTVESELISENQLKSGTISNEEIDELIFKIEGYVAEGYLDSGIANSLILKLKNARKSLEKGNDRAASNQLRAVQNQLEDLISEGTIDASIGEDIISDIEEIQDEWTCGQPFVDERDGHIYQTVKIGDQCWMAENLAYLPSVSPSTEGSFTDPYYYVYGYGGYETTEAKAVSNYSVYGVLYNWPAAIVACPVGWHLPSDTEWEQLAQYISEQMGPYEISGIMWTGVGGHLKTTSGWFEAGNGTDDFGFSALPGGYVSGRDVGGFYAVITNGQWWSSTENDINTSWYRYLSYQSNGILRYYNFRKAGASVRCVRD
jgi:uncharacterized protein (TIGR02145 family)